MNITDIPYTKINWDEVRITKNSGESGYAWRRTFESGKIRIRLIEYSPDYIADHWCCRGHVIHLLEGEMVFELKDGLLIVLKRGMTWCMSDNSQNPHRSFTKTGAVLFIVD